MFSDGSEAAQSTRILLDRAGSLRPSIALILGSGLGTIVDSVGDATAVPFDDLPGFPRLSVQGHAGRLVLGRMAGTDVAVMQGRAHYYETGDAAAMKVPLQTLAALGCRTVILTNSAGSLRPEAGPGSLMLITDHINFAGINPLIGETGNDRFVDMTEAYDPTLRARMTAVADRLEIPLHQGVYIWFSGPSFETPAEIRAARALGADAVGMSTVPEVLLARWLGLKVGALSIITNAASGMGEKALTHDGTIVQGARAAANLGLLLTAFLGDGADG